MIGGNPITKVKMSVDSRGANLEWVTWDTIIKRT